MVRAEVWDDPDRWRQWIPRPPVIPTERRRQLAQEWVDFLGVDVSEDFIEALSAVVMRYHPLSPKGQIANRLICAGEVPYRERVETVYAARAMDRTQSGWRLPDNVSEVLPFIEQVNRLTGSGPTWNEVGEHMTWTRETVRAALRRLQREGQVTYTSEGRSLRVCRGEAPQQ